MGTTLTGSQSFGETGIKTSQPGSFTGGGTTTSTGTSTPAPNFQTTSGQNVYVPPPTPTKTVEQSTTPLSASASYGTPNVPYGTPGIIGAIAAGGGPVTTTNSFSPAYPLSGNNAPYSTGTPNVKPMDYGYLTPGYFGAIGKDYQNIAASFADKAASAEASRQNAATPAQEAKFALLGAGYGYGAIGTQAIGTALQSGSRFMEGIAVGGLFSGAGAIAAKNEISNLAFKGVGYGLAGIYGYQTIKNVGTAVDQGKTPQERLLGTGTVLGGTIADIGGFSVGKLAADHITGTPFYTPSSRTKIDVRNVFSEKPVVDYVRLPQSAKTTDSFAMTVGGRPASERAGSMTKGELRERKSGNMQPFKVDVTNVAPNTDFYSLQGKGIERSLRKGEIVPTQGLKTIDSSGGVSFDIVQYKQRVGGLPVTVTTDFANRPGEVGFFSGGNGVSSRLRKLGPSYSDMQDNAIASRTIQSRQQAVQSFFNLNFKGNSQNIASPKNFGGNQESLSKSYSPPGMGAYHYGGFKYDTTKTDSALVPQHEYGSSRSRQSGIPLGSPEDRRMRAFARLRDYGANYRDRQNNQRIIPFNTNRGMNPYQEPGRPAFRNTEGLLGSQRFGDKTISGTRSTSDIMNDRAIKNDIASRYDVRSKNGQAQLPDTRFGLIQSLSPAQAQLPAQKGLMDFGKPSITPDTPVPPPPTIPSPPNIRTGNPPPPIPTGGGPPPPIGGGGKDIPPPELPQPGFPGLPSFGAPGRSKVSGIGRQQSFRYAPSFSAIAFNIHGKQPKHLTGFETRPLTKGGFHL